MRKVQIGFSRQHQDYIYITVYEGDDFKRGVFIGPEHVATFFRAEMFFEFMANQIFRPSVDVNVSD